MSAPTQSEIEEALTCQCGCGLTVHNCNHLQCPSGIPLKHEIAEQLGRGGVTRAEVLDHFASKYGEKILSAPTTTGFNVVAWVTPFAAMLLAGMVIVVLTRRWRRRAAVAATPVAPADAKNEAWRTRLDAELERYDR